MQLPYKFIIIITALILIFYFASITNEQNIIVAADPAPKITLKKNNELKFENLTSSEIERKIALGFKTVILPTGGIEQNGPFVTTNKHNLIVEYLAEKIAAELKNTLVAPVIKFVPQGALFPPDGHMRFAGTISVTEKLFEQLLEETAESLLVNGFKEIIFVGDSFGNQVGMSKVAAMLKRKFPSNSFFYIPEYYDIDSSKLWLQQQELGETNMEFHDEIFFTSQLAVVSLQSVNLENRFSNGRIKLNGIDISSPEKIIAIGQKIISYRIQKTILAISKQRAAQK